MDATASFQANLPLPSFIIRIQLPSGEATDWRIDSEISFHDVLVSIIAYMFSTEGNQRMQKNSFRKGHPMEIQK